MLMTADATPGSTFTLPLRLPFDAAIPSIFIHFVNIHNAINALDEWDEGDLTYRSGGECIQLSA